MLGEINSAFDPTARHRLATDNDPTLGEAYILANLQHLIPARAANRRRDEPGADVAF